MTKVIERRHPNNRGLPREEVRGRIYAAALAIFRKKGFAAATVEEIASAAKVAKGTVFNFFPTKGAILLGYYEEIDAKFGAAMAKMSPAKPKTALAAFYGEVEALLRAEGSLVDDIFRELAADAAFRQTDDASGGRDRDALVAFFHACKERGTLSAEVEPAVAGHIVSDLWSATVQDWLRFDKRYSLKLRLATKLEVLFKGLAPAARSLVAALLAALAAVAIQPSRAAEVSQANIAAMQGLYEDAQGDIAIAPFSEFGDASFFIDYTSGRVGPLLPKQNGFAIGIGMKSPRGEAGTVTRSKIGLRVRIDGTGYTLDAVSLDIAAFDPAPHWANVHVPVLAVFGGKDLIVPVMPNRALVAKMLSENGNPATKTVVIAGINHIGMIAKTGAIAEYPALDRYDPAYFQTFGDWLDTIAIR